MKLLTNESNLKKLKSIIKSAESEIMISSGWITSGMLRRVIDKTTVKRIQEGELKLRVLIRLGDPVDVKITDPGVFKLIHKLGEHAELKYHRTLHAKMYMVDNKWALVGSFNLTGGGFGSEEDPGGNPESGFEFTEPDALKQVRARFDQLWEHEDVKELSRSLLGFVISPAEASEFWMLGIRDLPMNHFVQVRTEENEYIIGKVVESQKQDLNYFNENIAETDPRFRNDIMDMFGRSDLGGQAKAITTVPRENLQLKLARIKVTNKIFKEEFDLKLMQAGVPVDVASEVHTADKTMLEMIFNQANFSPAVLFANEDIEVGLDPLEITTKHFCIFGSTGSGKSYFAKQLIARHMYDWYCKLNKGRIIIFDPHGEYGHGNDLPDNFVNNKRQFETIDASRYNARLIRDADDLEDALSLKYTSRDEKARIDRVVRNSVKAGLNNKQFLDALKREALQKAKGKKIDINKELGKLTADIDASFYQYLSELKDLASKVIDQELDAGIVTIEDLKNQYGTKDKSEAKRIHIFEKVKSIYNTFSPEMQKTLKEQVINKNITKKLETYLREDIWLIAEDILEAIDDAFQAGEVTIEQLDLVNKMNKPRVYQVDLSGIHEEEIRHKITASILTQIFEEKKGRKDAVMNTLFLIEEAHNFAPEGGGRNNPAARIIQKIAAEGRKFNLGLIVITQRPAQVSKGVLSQCSSQAIFRLINQNDLNQIKEVVEGVSEAEVNLLPQFEQGQAIFSGVGIRQPVIVRGK